MANASHAEPRRIFVVGCPRSGTTLVQALLSLHPRIFCFKETYVFESLPPLPAGGRLPVRAGDTSWNHSNWRRLTASLRMRRRMKRALRRMELPGCADAALKQMPVLPGSRRRLVSQAMRAMDRVAAEMGRPIWAEKTPWHLHYLPDLLSADPEARVIHVVRSGTDVVASGYDLLTRYGDWGTPETAEDRIRCVDAAMSRWIQDIHTTLRWQGDPNHMVLRYENLVEHPEGTLDEVGRFLGMDFEPAMPLDLTRSPAYLAEGPWNVIRPNVSDRSGKKFETLFDSEMKQYVLRNLANISGLDRLPGPAVGAAC